jgi:hypothetical protein
MTYNNVVETNSQKASMLYPTSLDQSVENVLLGIIVLGLVTLALLLKMP